MYQSHGTQNMFDYNSKTYKSVMTETNTYFQEYSNFYTELITTLYEFWDIMLIPLLYVLSIYIMYRYMEHTGNSYIDDDDISTTLEDRMKHYENVSQSIKVVPNDSPFIIRLNGRTFANLTRKIRILENYVPYSQNFQNIMLLTTETLQKEFKCATAYTHSDEITLVFNKANPESHHIFGGKVFKLLSLTASCASNAFLYNLMSVYGNALTYNEPIMFDSRVIVFPPQKEYEIVNHMIWRSKGDSVRNFISMYAEKYLGKKHIQNMSNDERLKELKEKGYDLNADTINFGMKHGVFIKYDKETKTNTRYVFKNLQFSNEMYNFLISNHDYDQYLKK